MFFPLGHSVPRFSADPRSSDLVRLAELTQKRIREAKLAAPVSSLPSRAAPARRTSPAIEVAPRGSCAAETSRLASHRPVPSALQLQFAAGQVRARGYGVLVLEGAIDDQADYRAGGEACTAGGIAVQLDALRAAGARAVLVKVRSSGGLVTEGLGMARALRRFSASAGPVIAHVTQGRSMAACVAAAADYVVAGLPGELFFHHAQGGDDEGRLHADASMLSLLAWRSATPEWDLRALRDREATVGAFDAEELGLVDEVGDSTRAAELARACGETGSLVGVVPRTERQLALSDRRKHSRWS